MMGWFDWLKPRRASRRQLPESRWQVITSQGRVDVADHEGNTRGVALSDLSGVIIETNDTGPWGADVWWLMFGKDDRLACAFPQGANGESSAIDLLTTLPGFDHLLMIEAMASTDNQLFPVWRRVD